MHSNKNSQHCWLFLYLEERNEDWLHLETSPLSLDNQLLLLSAISSRCDKDELPGARWVLKRSQPYPLTHTNLACVDQIEYGKSH